MADDISSLAPEILEICPFCLESNKPAEIDVRLYRLGYKQSPSQLVILQKQIVLKEVTLRGNEDSVRVRLQSGLQAGILNVVVIAESLPGDVKGEGCHITSVAPVPVLPSAAAGEMMRVFNDTVLHAKQACMPQTEDEYSTFLLSKGHIITDEQERAIRQMLWRKHFRPFVADLDFLLNDMEQMNQKENMDQESGNLEINLLKNIVTFLFTIRAFHTLGFVLRYCMDQGVVLSCGENDLTQLGPDALEQLARYHSQCLSENVGLYSTYSNDAMGGDEVEGIVGEQLSEIDAHSLKSSFEIESMDVGTRNYDDAAGFDRSLPMAWEGEGAESLGGNSWEDLGSQSRSSEVHHQPTHDFAEVLGDNGTKKLEPVEYEHFSGNLVDVSVEPSFISGLLTTESAPMSLLVMCLLVSCWLYLVWGETDMFLSGMSVCVLSYCLLALYPLWNRHANFAYRDQLVLVSRSAIIVILVLHGLGFYKCPCICDWGKTGNCFGGMLQSFFWLLMTSPGYQSPVRRQVALFLIELLAFVFAVSRRGSDCTNPAVMGAVLLGELISLGMVVFGSLTQHSKVD